MPPTRTASRRWQLRPIHRLRSPESYKGAAAERVAKEGSTHRTATRARRQLRHQEFIAWLPDLLPGVCQGGNLSMGDIHWSQGDGEISFCGAIEMSGYLDLHVDLIKGGVSKYGMVNPIFKPGPVEPRYSEYLVFEGISVDEQGKQYYLDAHVAYRRACLNAIEYLKKFGYSGEQGYMLISTAPCEGKISGIVDIPNACCTLHIPTEIFDFDIRPSATGPTSASRGAVSSTT